MSDSDVSELITEETRFKIIQRIIGHPMHLLSLEELIYMTSKSAVAVRNQLEVLCDSGIIDVYRREDLAGSDGPVEFYGFTEHGVRVIDNHNYLDGLGAERALYDKTVKPEKVRQHENAPRPPLPLVVRNAFAFDDE